MIDLSTVDGRIVAAALRLAAERPWREVTILDIAEAAGVGLSDVRKVAATKPAILALFGRMVDDQLLATVKRPPAGQSVRDTLFELVMNRFDVLALHKPALRSIAASETGDPYLWQSAMTSIAWLLEAAGADTAGLAGKVRLGGLAAVYASVFRTWLDDDDAGMARTMAVLDRRLRRGEQTLTRVTGVLDALDRVTSMWKPASSRGPGATPSPDSPNVA